VGLLLASTLACNLSTASTPSPTTDSQSSEAPAISNSSQTEGSAADSATISLDTTNPCNLLTKQQVEAAFGKSVQEMKPQEQYTGHGCQFKFGENDAKFAISSYEGEGGKQFFAPLIIAGKESCDKFTTALFDAAFAPLTGKQLDPEAQALLASPSSDLYRQYVATMEPCMYVHSQDRPDIAANPVETETIFTNWTSNVALLYDDRVVEFSYEENLPDEAKQNLAAGTDKEKFYALADPYRQDVLSGYAEKLADLLNQAAGN
jgi:hypothetical protein